MQIILASQSPRRKFMLTEMGVSFIAIPSEFDEQFNQAKSADKVAQELALGKAQNVAEMHPDAIVIGADTIVVLDGKQLGKPDSAQEASKMLQAYRNRSHQIVTGVAVVCRAKDYVKIASDSTEIYFDDLPDDVIKAYIATNNPFDKAGAYALQHPLIRPHITEVKGRIDTTIGLPTNILSAMLKDFDIDAPPLDLSDDTLLKKIDFYE